MVVHGVRGHGWPGLRGMSWFGVSGLWPGALDLVRGLWLAHVNSHWSNTTDLAQGSGIRNLGHASVSRHRLVSSLGMGKIKVLDGSASAELSGTVE